MGAAESRIEVFIKNIIYFLHDHLTLLKYVKGHPELVSPGPSLDLAITRYKIFMYLRSKGYAERSTLDVEWIWHVHRLHPVAYEKDCIAAFKRVIPHQSKKIQIQDINLVTEIYSKDYDFLEEGMKIEHYPDMARFDLSIDIVAAVHRQERFLEHLDTFMNYTASQMKGYAKQYVKFLRLLVKFGDSQMLVPTIGIDIIWHTHMRYPEDYISDTKEIFGKILDHFDDIDEEAMQPHIDATKRLWLSEYKLDNLTCKPVRPGFLSSDKLISNLQMKSGVHVGGWNGAGGYSSNDKDKTITSSCTSLCGPIKLDRNLVSPPQLPKPNMPTIPEKKEGDITYYDPQWYMNESKIEPPADPP